MIYTPLAGTIAPTDEGWYRFLLQHPAVREINFWRPSARRRFIAPEFSPFLFKLRAPHNAICGFAYFASYSPLPIWLAWETFGRGASGLGGMPRRVTGAGRAGSGAALR